jgi:hypothetical protein
MAGATVTRRGRVGNQHNATIQQPAIRWSCWLGELVNVFEPTKSEARAAIKKLLGLKRLPTGCPVVASGK